MTNPNDRVICSHVDHYGLPCSMLSKREFFAAMALREVASAKLPEYFNDKQLKDCASGCVRLADALIAELNKPSAEEGA